MFGELSQLRTTISGVNKMVNALHPYFEEELLTHYKNIESGSRWFLPEIAEKEIKKLNKREKEILRHYLNDILSLCELPLKEQKEEAEEMKNFILKALLARKKVCVLLRSFYLVYADVLKENASFRRLFKMHLNILQMDLAKN